MNKYVLILLLSLFAIADLLAQKTSIEGNVIHAVSGEPIPEVSVYLVGSTQVQETTSSGSFYLDNITIYGEQILIVNKEGFIKMKLPLVINKGDELSIKNIHLQEEKLPQKETFTVLLSETDFNEDTSRLDNIPGLLQSSRDVFQRTAAFEFGSSFFKMRGLNSNKSTVMINGLEMNRLSTGRPQWNNWGGLNDLLRNTEFTTGLQASAYAFGNVLGTTNINTRASAYRKGSKITYSSSNRSYTNRLMISHASGLQKNGWSYAFMVGRRWGNEGFREGTLYDANSFLGSIEKQLNKKHSINATVIYTPHRKGKSASVTNEVFNLKGRRYNEYWGNYNGEQRNSRIRKIEEPILTLTHNWAINTKTDLSTSVGYQYGKVGNTRIDNSGGTNPSPAYYKKLPSYFLSNPNGPNYSGAYLAEQAFLNDGQLNWNELITANQTRNLNGDTAAYILSEDRNDEKTLTLNSIFRTELTERIELNASVNYKQLKSQNYAQVKDLLGSAVGVSNKNQFNGLDFNTNNPNFIAKEGDKYRYNYNLYANQLLGFVQGQFKYRKVDFFVAGSFNKTSYQREGLFNNEAHLGNSFGKGNKINFLGLGTKVGATYKISGKHLVTANIGFLQQAPNLRNTFSNSRSNNDVVGIANGVSVTGIPVKEELITATDISYIFRSEMVKARVTGFYIKEDNINDVSFYFADGINGFVDDNNVVQDAVFISEVLQGVSRVNLGMELGVEAQVTSTIKLKGVLSLGQYTYANNPNLYVTANNQFVDFGQSYLKDYKVGGGPQKAASIGFEYRDPKYWWFGATANFFSNAYVAINPLNRTTNFSQDKDGLVFADYDPEVARNLLKQEQFNNYMVINLTGGKSWKVGSKYIGCFLSVGNLLNETYKTGGFEQGRNANYRELKADVSRPKRVFGSRYWYGLGANYFLNMSLRF